MNATEVAKELHELKEAEQAARKLWLKRKSELQEVCTHIFEDGGTAKTTPQEPVWGYCRACDAMVIP